MTQHFDYMLDVQKACKDELQRVTKSIQGFFRSASKIVDNNNHSHLRELEDYKAYLSNVSDIMDCARKLDITLHLNGEIMGRILKSAASDEVESTKPPPEDVMAIQNSTLPAEAAATTESSYVKKDLGVYLPGSQIKAIITHVKDPERMLFFVCDLKSTEIGQLADMHKFNNTTNLTRYKGLPPFGHIFGLTLDDSIFRAIREEPVPTPLETSTKTERAFLVDLGESVDITKDSVMHKLQRLHAEIPAQALLCAYYCDSPTKVHEAQALIQDSQFSKPVTICVREVKENILQVEFVEKKKYASLELYGTTKNNQTQRTQTNEPMGISDQDIKAILKGPLSTSDKMKPVDGFGIRSNKPTCRFFNPATGGCFKGVNCPAVHESRHPEGWTKDSMAVLPSDSQPQMQFMAESIITITPTSFVNLNTFYAQIEEMPEPTAPLIWNMQDITKEHQLAGPPQPHDIIRVKTKRNLWYRGTVLEVDYLNQTAQVFLVDYGNRMKVAFSDLAQSEPLSCLEPFQAIRCRLLDVVDVTTSIAEFNFGLGLLSDFMLNNSFKVRVVDQREDLLVQMVEERFERHFQSLMGKTLLQKKD